MARPQKEGLAYFSLDVDFFSDRKVKILKGRFGADGTLLGNLIDSFYKLLSFHGINLTDTGKMFRRKGRDSLKGKLSSR